MEFFDVVQNRRCIRKFKKDAIPEDKLLRVLDAGRLAPSWANKQCWRFILVRDESLREKMNEIMNGNPGENTYTEAPAVLVVCADPSNSGKKDGKEYYMLDIGIALEHVALAATAEGLGSCWIGWFDEKPLKNLLNVPEESRVVALMPLGYPDEQPAARPRKDMDDILYHDQWRDIR